MYYFQGGQIDCNLMLYLSTTHVLKISGGVIAPVTPPGSRPVQRRSNDHNLDLSFSATTKLLSLDTSVWSGDAAFSQMHVDLCQPWCMQNVPFQTRQKVVGLRQHQLRLLRNRLLPAT